MGDTEAILGVAVVGLGVGEQHLRAYLGQNACRLRWVYDTDETRSQEIVRTYGVGTQAIDYNQVLDDPKTAIVSIASYDDAHAEQVVAALEAGKHVFVEKPLCRTPDELEKIRTAWMSNRECHLRSNLVLRAAPLYRWLRDAIQNDVVGDVYALDGDYLYGRLEKITKGWRKNVSDYSVMQGGGVHMVDLMLWLTGQRPAAVFSSGNRISTVGTEFQFSDYVVANYSFDSGLIGRISANFGCMHRHQHVLRVFGTKASFVYDDQGPRLYETRDPSDGPKRISENPLPVDKGDLIPGFVRSILGNDDPALAVYREFSLIQTCLSADLSLRRGEEVHLEYGF